MPETVEDLRAELEAARAEIEEMESQIDDLQDELAELEDQGCPDCDGERFKLEIRDARLTLEQVADALRQVGWDETPAGLAGEERARAVLRRFLEEYS